MESHRPPRVEKSVLFGLCIRSPRFYPRRMNLAKVAVVGATGYSGEELVRLLSRHPGVEVASVTSRQHAGKALQEIYPRFRGQPVGELQFTPSEPANIVESGAKIAFLALPHGVAAGIAVPLLDLGARVIDLSADFRLKDEAVYQEYYGAPHLAPGLLARGVYGLPEIHRAAITQASLVASPGCYPTSIILPLAPLLREGLIEPDSIAIVSLSGVSGGGRKAEIEYSFVECNESARPYGVPKHRHLAEIEQELTLLAGKNTRINFTPVLVPLNRGILSTIYCRPSVGVTPARISEAMAGAYKSERFVRLLPEPLFPDLKNVTYTNFIDIAWRHDPRTGRVILMSALDNLVKGASGQALQSLNLMLGCPEETALL